MKKLIILSVLLCLWEASLAPNLRAADVVLYSNRSYDDGYLAGSNFVWQIPPVILGPTNATSGDTLTFTNGQNLVWTHGSTFTNWCTFTNAFFNLTVTQQIQQVSVWNGRATGYSQVLVTPLPPIPSFTGTPTSGTPPLSVLFTNLSTGGAYTNVPLWTFVSTTGATNTLSTNALSFTHVFGSGTNDYSTNSVSLALAGYGGVQTLTLTNYIMATALVPGSLIFDGSQNYATISNSQATAALVTAPFTYEFWLKTEEAGIKDVIWTTTEGYPFFFTLNALSVGGLRTAGPSVQELNITNICDGVWHHVALQTDGTVQTAWRDGVMVDSNGNWSAYAPVTSDIGLSAPGGDGYFAGSLALFRISNTVRYTTNFTAPTSLTVDTNTLCLIPFTEATGTTASDSTGNHPAILLGDPVPTWGTFP